MRDISGLKEITELRENIKPRDHRVFFGALDSSKLGFGHRMIRKMPAAREALAEGDFREWNDIEAWASSIAQELKALARASQLWLFKARFRASTTFCLPIATM